MEGSYRQIVVKIDRALIHLEAEIKVTGWRKNAPPVAFSQQPTNGPGQSRGIGVTISEICIGRIPGAPAPRVDPQGRVVPNFVSLKENHR